MLCIYNEVNKKKFHIPKMLRNVVPFGRVSSTFPFVLDATPDLIYTQPLN